ncbi:MAG: ABC transporter substrate-binding protein [Candidatus Bipolaricaulaceae bacterium]
MAGIADVISLDPAWHYDIPSAQVIFNVYETLIFYERQRVDKFVPVLAESWTVSEDGMTYTFVVRKGIKFHLGGDLTPEDVAYSLHRLMIQDRTGGPAKLVLEPLLNVRSIKALAEAVGDEKACEMVKSAVIASEDTVIIRLAKPMPVTAMLQILAGTWCSIVDKEWVIAQGGWDHGCTTWRKWHDPKVEESELFNKMNGTGPFMLKYWKKGDEIVLERNENYWGEKPKLRLGIFKVVPEWGTRLLMFKEGDADIIAVPRANISAVEPLVAVEVTGFPINKPFQPVKMAMKNPLGTVRVFKDLVGVSLDVGFMNFEVVEGSPFIPELGGLPKRDFFADEDVRKAFSYAIDYQRYIEEAYLGEAFQPRGVIPYGFLGYNPEQWVYSYDPEKVAEHLKKAWNGELWEKGFKLIVHYNTGNLMRKAACEMLELHIEALNKERPGKPPFVIEVRDLPWATFLGHAVAGRMPFWVSGWVADYIDPHNFAHPFLHSAGALAVRINIARDKELSAKFDELIEKGIATLDPSEREKIYFEINRLAVEHATHIWLVQPTRRAYQRLWVLGWYDNPLEPGARLSCLWKASLGAVALSPREKKTLFESPEARHLWFWIENLGPGRIKVRFEWEEGFAALDLAQEYVLEPGSYITKGGPHTWRATKVLVEELDGKRNTVVQFHFP